jgi:phosphate transport system protein
MIYIIDNDFEKLKIRLHKMLALVEEQVEFAFRVLQEFNAELANLVIERDKTVDKHDVKIEKLCQKIYASQTLSEEDSRYLMAVMPMVMNLERIGDISENICRKCIHIHTHAATCFCTPNAIQEMCRLVQKMIKGMVQAVEKKDADLAHNVRLYDVIVDRLNAENFTHLKNNIIENVNNTDCAIHYILISKDLERLADHITDIAEQVIFIVEAEVIRHKFIGDIR